VSHPRFEELYEGYCDGTLTEVEREEFLGLLENPECRAQLVRFSTYEAAVGEELKLAGTEQKPSSRTNPKVGSRRIPIQTPVDEDRMLGRIAVAAAAAVILILVLVFVTSSKPDDARPVVVRPKPEPVVPRETPAPEAPKVAPEPPPAPKETPAPPPEDPLKPRTFVPALPKKDPAPAPPPTRPEPKSTQKPAPTRTEEPRESVVFVATVERVSGEVAIGAEPAEAGKGIASGRTVTTGRMGFLS